MLIRRMEEVPEISIIIPALNAEAGIARAIASVSDIAAEIIVVDGGSEDGTASAAREAGARVIESARGRGAQLAAGALEATGDWLLFLHADTRLGASWPVEAVSLMRREETDIAAAFAFALDDDGWRARLVERAVAFRCRRFGLAWGDQGLLISREFYHRLGGYRADYPLFEDADLIRRIGRKSLRLLETRAVTSAVRYRRDGYFRRALRNTFCLTLYLVGVLPASIKKIYR